MVEKIWICSKCDYVPQDIHADQPTICPKCGEPCRQADYIPAEYFEADTKPLMEDAKREGE